MATGNARARRVGAAPEAPSGEPGDGLAADAVVALCQALKGARYARFVKELSATADAARTTAVVRRWTTRALNGARRRRLTRGRGGHSAALGEPADTTGGLIPAAPAAQKVRATGHPVRRPVSLYRRAGG